MSTQGNDPAPVTVNRAQCDVPGTNTPDPSGVSWLAAAHGDKSRGCIRAANQEMCETCLHFAQDIDAFILRRKMDLGLR